MQSQQRQSPMTQIRSLFDPQKGIQRSIEKVISYQASQEDRLKSEISEYIVTESIDEVAEEVFDRYAEAPERVETILPEKFLRAAATDLRSVTSQLDPLGLVVSGGTPSIKTDHQALVSLLNLVET